MSNKYSRYKYTVAYPGGLQVHSYRANQKALALNSYMQQHMG